MTITLDFPGQEVGEVISRTNITIKLTLAMKGRGKSLSSELHLFNSMSLNYWNELLGPCYINLNTSILVTSPTHTSLYKH